MICARSCPNSRLVASQACTSSAVEPGSACAPQPRRQPEPDYPIEYANGKTSTWLGGHAGILVYSTTGVTQYYEYGRYNPNNLGIIGAKLPANSGNVRRVSTPNLSLGADGQSTQKSLDVLSEALSRKAGKGTKTELKCDVTVDEKKAAEYAIDIANNVDRKSYSWTPWNTNHCRTFPRDVFNAGRN